MAIKFKRSNGEVTIDTKERDAEFRELIIHLMNHLHRVEKQLEKITEETIDEDERSPNE